MLATFAPLDWAVLGGYFVLLAVTGVIFSRREQRSTDDYFLGSRSIPAWAAAVSILATSLSAATFIGGPQLAYDGNITYLAANLGMIGAIAVVAIFFIPAFYRHNVSTVYQLLGTRFGEPATRTASVAFIVGRVFASGARLFMVAIPASLIVFGDPGDDSLVPLPQMFGAIAAMTVVGVVYTLAGGIASVIWTDVIQTVVFIGAVVAAIAILLVRIPAPAADVLSALQTGGPGGASKLRLFDLSRDLSHPYSLLACLTGFVLLGIGSYGTDQDLAQRMLTCRSAARGAWSAVAGVLMGIPAVLTFLVVGLLLFVFYLRPELMGASAPGYSPPPSQRVFLTFILRELPAGMTGLMMAGLFAAGLSSLNSAINAMASAFVIDFYKQARPRREARHYVRVGRLAVIFFGVILGSFACVCVVWQRRSDAPLIDFALGVMTFAYAGLVGAFFAAIFTRRGSAWSVILAIFVGFWAIFLLQPFVWDRFRPELPAVVRAVLPSDTPAFAWRMLVATGIAFFVAVIPPPPRAAKIAP